ncbi:MAG: hypothetical protein NZM37_05305 [Sandaracinaceae bacterium]|nr:hypothetical protein [Sandaracinaceae bacterium]
MNCFLGLLFVVSEMACITQDIQFNPPSNFPPSIEVPLGASGPEIRPLNELIRLRADEIAGGGDAGPMNTLRWEVIVRDPDVDQELQYLIFVDYQRGVTIFPTVSGFIPPVSAGAQDRRVRPLRVQVPLRGEVLSRPGCHRIELLVSQRFRLVDGIPSREPVMSGDIGTATWWVATQAREGDPVDMTGCP